jgi:hypothetical protein
MPLEVMPTLCVLIFLVAKSVYWQGYRLDDWGSIPGKGGEVIFFLCHHIQTSTGVHPASYPLDTTTSFPGVKWTSSAEVKNMWAIPQLSIHLCGMAHNYAHGMSSWCGTWLSTETTLHYSVITTWQVAWTCEVWVTLVTLKLCSVIDLCKLHTICRM